MNLQHLRELCDNEAPMPTGTEWIRRARTALPLLIEVAEAVEDEIDPLKMPPRLAAARDALKREL